jgi:hypothetical protein
MHVEQHLSLIDSLPKDQFAPYVELGMDMEPFSWGNRIHTQWFRQQERREHGRLAGTFEYTRQLGANVLQLGQNLCTGRSEDISESTISAFGLKRHLLAVPAIWPTLHQQIEAAGPDDDFREWKEMHNTSSKERNWAEWLATPSFAGGANRV